MVESRKRRLFVLTNSLGREAGGLFYSVRSLCFGFEAVFASSHEVRVIGAAPRDPSDFYAWGDLDVIPVNSFNRVTQIVKLFARSSGSDCFLIQGIWNSTAILGVLCSALFSRRVFIFPRGMLYPEWHLRSRLKKSTVVKLCQIFGRKRNLFFVALNEREKSHIAQVFPCFGILVAHNPVPVDAYPLVERRTKSAAVQRFLFIGRIDRKKCVLEMVRGFKLFAAAQPVVDSVFLDIYGWGNDDSYYEQVARECGGSVRLHAPVWGDAKYALMRISDCFVLGSRGEGEPMSVLEAFSLGLPCLLSKGCNFGESHLGHPFYFELETVCADGFLAGFHSVMRSNQVDERAANAMSYVNSHHSKEVIAAKLIESLGDRVDL